MRLKLLVAVIVGVVMALGIPAPQRPVAYNGPRDTWYLEPTERPPETTLTGIASWYPAGSWYTRKTQWFKGTRHYAAAGRELRKMIQALWPGHRYWHQTPVRARITNPKTGISVLVYITDICGCYSGTPKDRSDDKIIDLSPEVFQALGVRLGRGIQKVSVELLP